MFPRVESIRIRGYDCIEIGVVRVKKGDKITDNMNRYMTGYRGSMKGDLACEE